MPYGPRGGHFRTAERGVLPQLATARRQHPIVKSPMAHTAQQHATMQNTRKKTAKKARTTAAGDGRSRRAGAPMTMGGGGGSGGGAALFDVSGVTCKWQPH